MNETTIECPSCNRRIRIALKTPIKYLMDDSFDPSIIEMGKEYDVRDVLWMNDELANRYDSLYQYTKKLEMLLWRE